MSVHRGLSLVTVHPGLLHAGLHPLLVLAPVLLEQLRRHRVSRRVRVGVTQLNRNSNVKSKSILGTFSEYRDNFLFSLLLVLSEM